MKSLTSTFIRTAFLTVVLCWSACSPTPRDIQYGEDNCHFCKMTIVDRQHAAESVTSKGKVYMYDAIECMINDLAANQSTEWAFLLVNDYEAPSELIPAEESHYLVSKAIPSPMGAFLTAFSDKKAAEQVMALKEGELYDWKGINEHLNKDLSQE